MEDRPFSSTAETTEKYNYPFLIDSTTVSYIRENGRVMFIIRGLPFTGKAKMSQILMETYPNADCCSIVKHLHILSPIKELSPKPIDTVGEAIKLCNEGAEKACQENKIIIIQNTHMAKYEFQHSLNLAVQHNYAVVLIVTCDQSKVTLQEISNNNPNGFNKSYLKKRCDHWEDVLPLFTGWFISSDDSQHVHNFILKSLETLLEDPKFCEVFNVDNGEELRNYFHLRKILTCIAGHFETHQDMKDYYFSPEVRHSYGKTYTIAIVGYLVTTSWIIGIVQIDELMEWLIADSNQEIKYVTKRVKRPPYSTRVALAVREEIDNVSKHRETFQFQGNDPLSQRTSVTQGDWIDNWKIDIKRSGFIHLAQRDRHQLFDIPEIKRNFTNSLKLVSDNCGLIYDDGFEQVGNQTKICKLPNNVWLVKPPHVVNVKTIFTGFYP